MPKNKIAEVRESLKRDYISTTEAAIFADTSRTQIINWCKIWGIGKKVIGRWYVNKQLLHKLITGELQAEYRQAGKIK